MSTTALPWPGRARGAVATLAVAVAVGALLGRFVLAGRGPAPRTAPRAPIDSAALVADLQQRLRAAPDQPRLLSALGVAYLDRYRETADPGYLPRAEQALARSLDLDAHRPDTLVGLGLLAAGRHDFAGALEWAQRAAELAPGSPEPWGVAYDALVELGRYPEAAAALQHMVDRRPSFVAHLRVAHLRELHGDRPGVLTALHLAMAAGARSPTDRAFAQAALGDLHLGGGDLEGAETAYGRALRLRPGDDRAEVGLARVEAARGRLAEAAARLERVVDRAPQPAWVALLGDVYAALGRTADAADQFAVVRVVQELHRVNGVAVDLELARFEADHATDPGADPALPVELARRALDRRPTVHAHDTLAWALRQAGRAADALPHARAAVALGTGDALFWYHLAAIEADAGLAGDARRHLDRALAINPHLTVRDLPGARALAAVLAPEVG